MAKKRRPCEWVTLEDALRTLVVAEEGTQGSSHIDPMHWRVACRLVIEGGFHPDLIKPRPPFVVKKKAGHLRATCFCITTLPLRVQRSHGAGRLEEAIGDCTNIHMSYPALVYGFLAKLLRSRTSRLVWDRDSPAVWDPRTAGMTPRVGDDTAEPVPSFEVNGAADSEDSVATLASEENEDPTE